MNCAEKMLEKKFKGFSKRFALSFDFWTRKHSSRLFLLFKKCSQPMKAITVKEIKLKFIEMKLHATEWVGLVFFSPSAVDEIIIGSQKEIFCKKKERREISLCTHLTMESTSFIDIGIASWRSFFFFVLKKFVWSSEAIKKEASWKVRSVIEKNENISDPLRTNRIERFTVIDLLFTGLHL